MRKPGSVAVAAVVLVVASVALAATRWAVLGRDIAGPRGASTWEVTLVAQGELTHKDASVTVRLPPDFRHQLILDEQFASKQLSPKVPLPKNEITGRGKEAGHRTVTWRAGDVQWGPKERRPFQLSCTFRCVLGVREPTPEMKKLTHELDHRPGEGEAVQPSAAVPSDHRLVRDLARELINQKAREVFEQTMPGEGEGGERLPELLAKVEEGLTAKDQVTTFFDHVSQRIHTDPDGPRTALGCLRAGVGRSDGKSRLLAALCRSRGVPARLITGLELVQDGEQAPRLRVEAWVDDHWLPMDPTNPKRFGPQQFPKDFLVLAVGDDDLIGSRHVEHRGDDDQAAPGPRFSFSARDLHNPAGLDEDVPRLKALFLKLSLFRLGEADRVLVRFLLLLPLAALIVSVYRTVIGVPTFGTFSPALLGLAFLDLKALRWGVPIFVAVVLVGWGMRHLLERFRLLQVPRTAALLTLIVLLLIAGVVAANQAGVVATRVISLFPLVILTHLVERFWTIEAEDGTRSSFKTLLGTLVVAVTVSLCLAWEFITAWMFRFPETLGVVIAAQFVLGRYTGYRLSELYRFGDLLKEEWVASPPAAAGGLRGGAR